MDDATLTNSEDREEGLIGSALPPPDMNNGGVRDPEKATEEPIAEPPPDGGYGWVVCIVQFICNATTFGIVTSFGVFLSFYREENFFPDATDLQYALIGGLIVGIAMLISPLSNYLSRRFGFKKPMILGVFIYTLGQIFAAFSTQIWELFLTQGIMMGLGIGLIFIPTLPILSQWFHKRRALAFGIAAGGSGGGSLVFSIITRAAIQNLGLRWAFIINALICFVLLVPCVLLIKDRSHSSSARQRIQTLQLSWLVHPGFLWVWIWGFFSLLGYVIAIFSIPTYATAGLGLSQTQGANLQAILAAGQMIGRPMTGLALDRIGRTNGAMLFTFIAGVACLVIWMVSRSYGVLILFAALQGLTGGTFWSACGPVTAECVSVPEMTSAMAILWLVTVIPNTFAEAIGISLVDYAQNTLGRTGADAYLICIGFAGGAFIVAAFALLGAKRHLQGNWVLWQKS